MRPGNFAVRRPVMMMMLMVAVILLGIISLDRLNLELLPRFQPPVLAVYTAWGDSSPQEVSAMVTQPLEGVVATVGGIKSLTSVSGEGASVIICEFNWGCNLDAARDDIKERLGFIPLPDDAQQPLVLRYDPTNMPSLRISVSGDVSRQRLEEIVSDILAQDIESVQGVAAVEVSGLQGREVRVLLDQQAMQSHGLQQHTVVQAIQAGNIVVPAGTVLNDELEANVRVLGQLEDPAALNDIILGAGPKGFLTLGQVAEIVDGWEPKRNILRTNGQSAVVLAVRKEGDANLVQVNRAVLERVEELSMELEDVELVVTMDQAKYIQDSIDSIGQNLLVGAGLAILVLLVGLQSPLSTLIITVSIPFSVLATFVLMQFTGLTLNIMSLGGLALGVGMMVDNSIVVIENIYRHLQRGLSAAEAAAKGTNGVTVAITGSTLTTLAVFIPVVYVGGITGELFRELAWTVSFSLLASLLVAVTVIPMLAAKILPMGKFRNAVRPRAGRGGYAQVVGWVLKRRWLVLAAVVVVLAVSVVPFQGLGREFLPSIDEGNFSINLTMPVGTPLEASGQVAQDVEKLLEGHGDVALCSTMVGGGDGRDMTQRGKNSASIDVLLVSPETRQQSTEEIMAWARRETKKLTPPDVVVSVQRQDVITSLAGSGLLEVNVQGKSLAKVRELAQKLMGKLQGLPQLTQVSSSLDVELPEQQIVILREQAAMAGLVPAQVAAQVGAAKNGQIATRLNMAGSHVNVRVQYTGLDTEEELAGLMLASSNGGRVPLGAVAEIIPGMGPMTLHSVNQQVTAQISAIIQEGDLGSVSKDVQDLVAQMDWPQGYSASIGGAGELMQDGFDNLYMALGLAIILVYIVMAALFESLLHPLIIILTLPLAAVGAVLVLYASGYALGITALIGVVMLVGIVVNNAIVMVDAINQLRAQGMATKVAIITGAGQRLRPILMTAFTTIIAMLPLAMGVGEGAELQAPLAAAVLGGLLSSTLLTLLVIPAIYYLLAGKTPRS